MKKYQHNRKKPFLNTKVVVQTDMWFGFSIIWFTEVLNLSYHE